MWQGLVFEKVNSYIFFVIILWGVRMPRQPFLIEGYDNLRALDVGLLGRNQVSLIRVLPFCQEHEFSAGVPGSNNLLWFQTLGKASQLFWLFFLLLWFALLPLIFQIRINFALASLWFICAVFCDCRNSAVRSGQSRFSSGSHVLSSSENPFHFSRYSTLPFTTQQSRTFSTTYSSSSSSSISCTFFLFCFFPHSARQLSGIKDEAAQSSAHKPERNRCRATGGSCPAGRGSGNQKSNKSGDHCWAPHWSGYRRPLPAALPSN